MGRSRKCNWKRKQLKANKKLRFGFLDPSKRHKTIYGESFRTEQEAKDRFEELKEVIILKKRRGGITVGILEDLMNKISNTPQSFWDLSDDGKVYITIENYAKFLAMKGKLPGHNPAIGSLNDNVLTLEKLKKTLLSLSNSPYSQQPEKLRGGAPDYTHMFRTADGRYIDPDLGEMNHMDSEELTRLFESAMPKTNSGKHIGVPMIFGTAGSVEQPSWAYEVYKNGIKDDKLFIPAHSYDEAVGDFPTLPKDFFAYDPNGRNK